MLLKINDSVSKATQNTVTITTAKFSLMLLHEPLATCHMNPLIFM